MSETTRVDGLHCVYGTCQGYPTHPRPCHPGCYFQMSAVSELGMVRVTPVLSDTATMRPVLSDSPMYWKAP